ncbi:MAG: dehydrogenase (ubiquinone) 24 kDa subunit [Verrucomicrobiaceae bacterium]|nr:dehydrogenase (ubiquinone) 24 kDa subunit [Verrucomicrobiaceae bacterium]
MPMQIPAALEAKIDEAITHYPVSKRSAVLPVLHLLQEHFRYLSEEAVNYTAQKLGLEPIKVLEVVTFYPTFRQEAPGKVHIRVCRTLACAMAGSYETMNKFCEVANIDRSHLSHHHPIAKSPDGSYSIEFVECLASCGSAPVLLVEDEFYEKVTTDKVSEVLAKHPA